MDSYVRVYDDILEADFCKSIIEKFEKYTEQHEKHQKGSMSFSQINLGNYMEVWKEESDVIYNRLMHCVARYANDCNIRPTAWPKEYGYESIRIKRYLADGVDEFGTHVDVTNYKNARRFLVFFAYLDDNEEGGTHLSDYGIVSPCKKGSVLVFPPMWPWEHRGAKPVDKPKYMVGSYLHYV